MDPRCVDPTLRFGLGESAAVLIVKCESGRTQRGRRDGGRGCTRFMRTSLGLSGGSSKRVVSHQAAAVSGSAGQCVPGGAVVYGAGRAAHPCAGCSALPKNCLFRGTPCEDPRSPRQRRCALCNSASWCCAPCNRGGRASLTSYSRELKTWSCRGDSLYAGLVVGLGHWGHHACLRGWLRIPGGCASLSGCSGDLTSDLFRGTPCEDPRQRRCALCTSASWRCAPIGARRRQPPTPRIFTDATPGAHAASPFTRTLSRGPFGAWRSPLHDPTLARCSSISPWAGPRTQRGVGVSVGLRRGLPFERR
jgi:hypothetical protein